MDIGSFQEVHFPLSLDEWIRKLNKMVPNSSIIWKVVIASFNIIGGGLTWKVGNGQKVDISLEPWVGGQANFRLPLDLVAFLNEHDKVFHNHVCG